MYISRQEQVTSIAAYAKTLDPKIRNPYIVPGTFIYISFNLHNHNISCQIQMQFSGSNENDFSTVVHFKI